MVWNIFFHEMHISCCSRDPSGIQDGRQYGRSMINNALCRKPAVKSEIPTANRTVSTTPDSLVTLPALPDVGRLPEFKMADCKPEVDCISGME